ncbi:MAG: hypothetical protein RIF41_34915, partial [Polyangiaceae bacterium]
MAPERLDALADAYQPSWREVFGEPLVAPAGADGSGDAVSARPVVAVEGVNQPVSSRKAQKAQDGKPASKDSSRSKASSRRQPSSSRRAATAEPAPRSEPVELPE